MKFPIGIQSFERIIQEGYIYVDKTDIIYDLTHNGSIYFLRGRKELFRGLAIEKMETEWNEYPVFHVDFNATNFTNLGELEKKLNFYLTEWEHKYNLPVRVNELGLGDRFIKILEAAHLQTGRRAVVLVDEYDKPMLDVLDVDTNLEDKHRNILKAFYSVFKGADKHLQFVLLTGVTKFSQVSVFSGFNQPKDISMDVRYEALCGITQEEIVKYFTEPVSQMAVEYQCTPEEMYKLLKKQYDGYHFSKRMTDIYNPFSLLNALDKMSIDDYWFSTGTPTYLIRLLNHSHERMNEFTGKYYTPAEFIDYKADVERPLPMIYQSGYLTIKAYDRDFNTFLLDFPNNEVKGGFLTMVASSYLQPSE